MWLVIERCVFNGNKKVEAFLSDGKIRGIFVDIWSYISERNLKNENSTYVQLFSEAER